MGSPLIGIVYIIIGGVIANSHGYLATAGSVDGLVSAVLAVLLWPLLLFGANLHLAL
jgi:hypothetical protein